MTVQENIAFALEVLGISKKEIGWITASFLLICILLGSFRKSVEKDEKNDYKNEMTEREIKLYKELKSDIMTSAKIDNMLKQRITSNIQHKKGDTIRHMQKMAFK